MEFIETLWKWPNDTLFVKKLCSELLKCIIVIFQLADDFAHLVSQWLFLCSTCPDWEQYKDRTVIEFVGNLLQNSVSSLNNLNYYDQHV